MTYPSRSFRACWLTAALALAVQTGADEAAAQGVDPGTSPKMPPNVLLIVDTSGSMEYEAGQETFPTCNPGGSGSERSRWVDAVEVLTGTIQNYSCQDLDRSSTTFTGLYQLPGSLNPPDYLYRNHYYRPLSGSCGFTPPGTLPWSTVPSNAFDWIAPALHPYTSNTGTCSPTFAQDPDGLIDTFTGAVRFGLMTFDTLPSNGDGFNGVSPLFQDGIDGAWSYFLTAGAAGMPFGCPTSATMEVGARNSAAPAWEGKMIPFGKRNADSIDNRTRDTRIEQVLLSTRPYGATPIAGALTDAQSFFTLDTTADPSSSTDSLYSTDGYGPRNDPYVLAGCRDQFIILLTDGEPNLDLRPDCEGGVNDPNCPYKKSEVVASQLNGLAKPIKTYVVGFAATTAGSVDCTTMAPSMWATGGTCDTTTDPNLRVCCTLHEIASAGGTTRAFFGNDKTALRTQLSAVFNQILAGGGSGTQPVRSPGVGDAELGTPRSVAFRILTSYEGSAGGLWRGTLERTRFVCDTSGVPVPQDKASDLGDDFSFNVNSHPTARTFATYIPATVSSQIYTKRSIRPNIPDAILGSDGVGKNAGDSSSGALFGTQTAITTGVPPEVFNSNLGTSPCLGTAAQCKALLLPWLLGGDNGSVSPNRYHRCATAASSPVDRTCSVIGDIIHSTPVIVDHPNAEIEDETYSKFRFNSTAKDRPMMVYTSSNDGFLHGFKLSPNKTGEAIVNTTASNELFAFIPPAVLPTIASQYPSNHLKLLDGAPVVQDVVATVDGSNSYYGYKLERSNLNAQSAAAALTYRTILVQAFGGSNAGYFAVDITEPTDVTTPGTFNTSLTARPRMLWQLTTDSAGNPLFGGRAATPLITTLNVGGTETAVAVLPGGFGAPTSSVCPRWGTAFPQIVGSYAPRQNVRCYEFDTNNDGTPDGTTTNIGARSLTIVRLDSGEVLLRFRRNGTGELPVFTDTSKVKAAFLDSPITGTPAAYPVGPGAVSDRIFVGDQDGTLWRIDTSSPTPSDWTMTLFFDTFSKHPGVGTPSIAGAAGRPIVTAPTLSVDAFGQITVASATGDQDLTGSGGTIAGVGSDKHYVWSLYERYASGTGPNFLTVVNWYQELSSGEHVLGPIRLNEGILYYSTFVPDSGDTNACVLGSSKVYGVDYLRAHTSGAGAGGLGRLSVTGVSGISNVATPAQLGAPADSIIFGVNLEYAPTCFTETAATAAFLGGSHLSPSAASASQLQLTFQTGSTKGSNAPAGFKTGFQATNLNRPLSAATVESWAAILE